MTTKVKAAAYRLIGGSKTVYSADYEEKISLFNNFKKQIEKLIGLVATLVTVSYIYSSTCLFSLFYQRYTVTCCILSFM